MENRVNDVLLVPDLTVNLLSISQICKNGFKVIFDSKSCQVINQDGDVFATGTQVNGLYAFDKCQKHVLDRVIV